MQQLKMPLLLVVAYQYILNSKIGNLYVVSGDTNDVFKVGEEVFLSINEKDIKVLND